jgi:hypothetical protein
LCCISKLTAIQEQILFDITQFKMDSIAFQILFRLSKVTAIFAQMLLNIGQDLKVFVSSRTPCPTSNMFCPSLMASRSLISNSGSVASRHFSCKDTPTPPTSPTVVHQDDAAPDVHTVPAQSATFDDSVMPGGDESAAILPADMSNGNRDSGCDQEGEASEMQEAAESKDSEADKPENTEENTPEDADEADAPEEQVGETQVPEIRYPRRERRPPKWWSASVARAQTCSPHESRACPSLPDLSQRCHSTETYVPNDSPSLKYSLHSTEKEPWHTAIQQRS